MTSTESAPKAVVAGKIDARAKTLPVTSTSTLNRQLDNFERFSNSLLKCFSILV